MSRWDSPLGRSIRSFWVPEPDGISPELRRAIREDKFIVALSACAAVFVAVGLVACLAKIVLLATAH